MEKAQTEARSGKICFIDQVFVNHLHSNFVKDSNTQPAVHPSECLPYASEALPYACNACTQYSTDFSIPDFQSADFQHS
jgi:hypothetical protein